jgi:two-component system, chemotaxis family, sensor kinase CheA
MSGAGESIDEIFRDEANERVERMVNTLIALEAGDVANGGIDSIFRDIHSIKGSAAMVGWDDVRDLAHSIEDTLSETRESGVIAADVIAPMLNALDELRVAVDHRPAAPEATPPLSAAPARVDVAAEPRTPAASVSGSPVERSSIRMPTAKVDRLIDAVHESVVQTRRFEYVLNESQGTHGDERTDWELGRGKVLLDELQRAAIDMRTLPLASITGGYSRAVRDTAAAAGNEVSLEIIGAETQLDRVILDGISEMLAHLLRNSVAHGIEPADERERAGKPRVGRIVLRAEPHGGSVAITLADDGRGVDAATMKRAAEAGSLAAVLCEPGYSTAVAVTEVAGRGVGLDAVKTHVESIGGSLAIDSEPSHGTTVTLVLPYSIALLSVLMIERGGQRYGLPLASVDEVAVVERPLLLAGSRSLEVRGRTIPLSDLAVVLGAQAPALGARARAVIVSSSSSRRAIACERVLGQRDVVVKSLGTLLTGVRGYLGAAIMDSGTIAPILDPAFLAERATMTAVPTIKAPSAAAAPKVLVVDDQFTVRELQRSILEAAGYRVATAREGRDALAQISADVDIQLVVTDLEMPGMGGIELVRMIRQDAQHAGLPVILVTSLSSQEDKERGAQAGANAYIVKDEFDQRRLLDTVERLLGVTR